VTLADRIASFLERYAPLTVEEIARDLRSRPQSVRDALRAEDRFVAVRLPNRSRRAVGWMLAAQDIERQDESGRVVNAT